MLLLSRSQIAGLLSLDDYRQIVEDVFRRHAEGASFEPALAHVDADEGEFHIKAGGIRGTTPYFAAKVNGGFFQNRARYGLPNIQGLILLSRADNGTPLAVMDSGEITTQRTGGRRLLLRNTWLRKTRECVLSADVETRAASSFVPWRAFYPLSGYLHGHETRNGQQLTVDR